MAYKKTNWQDTLRDAQGNVIQKGTPLNAQALGKIEDGIVAAEQKIDNEISQVTTQLAQTTKKLKDVRPVNVRDFGAHSIYEIGYSNFDSTQAIQDAINFALSDDGDGYVYIPSGYYYISDELIIPGSMKIEGLYNKGNTTRNSRGTHIHQLTSGKSVFRITATSYGTELFKMRLSGKGTGIKIDSGITVSEFVFEDLHFNGGFDVAIELRGTIGRISDCDFSANKIGILIKQASSIWIRNNNFWEAGENFIKFATDNSSATDVHFNENWMEHSGSAGILIQSPSSLYNVTFTDTEVRTNSGKYPILIDGKTNPTGILNLKKVSLTRVRLACIGGIDSVIRVQQAGNNTSGNNQMVEIRDSIFSYCTTAGISTDFKHLYWVLDNVTIYKSWESSVNKVKWHSPEGITGCVIAEINYDYTISTNAGIEFLPNNGASSFPENMMYLSGNTLYVRKDGTPKKIILASGTTITNSTATTIEGLVADYNKLLVALRSSGVIS